MSGRNPKDALSASATSRSAKTDIRTSITDPLRIAEVPVGKAGGLIGITFCPGKKGDSNRGAQWTRDLAADLDVIAQWGTAAVVTLLESMELRMLGVTNLGDEVRQRNMQWHHLPIVDVQPPGAEFEAAWQKSGPLLLDQLSSGKRVLVHCRGGLGRAGTVAARLLVETGMPAYDAIALVRRFRPGAIETQAQEAYVRALRVSGAPDAPGRGLHGTSTRDGRSSTSSKVQMDWFKRLTGFDEGDGDSVRSQLEVSDGKLKSKVNGRSAAIGNLELVSLATLRQRVKADGGCPGRLRVRSLSGDVRPMHRLPEYTGALFQVASQFNMLEMVGPGVSPEQGVTRYQDDGTQGPACAIAAGAATIYRNYFVPIGEGFGQTRSRQLDGLADVGVELARSLGQPVDKLWAMRNGYAMCTSAGLDAISRHMESLTEAGLDSLRGKLRVGLHTDVEVTDGEFGPGPLVSQVFCSALPVGYVQSVPQMHWQAFGTLILEAAYEATLIAAMLNAKRGGSKIVLLTRLGGGAFENQHDWIHGAMRRALRVASGCDIEIHLISRGKPAKELLEMAEEFNEKSCRSTEDDLSLRRYPQRKSRDLTDQEKTEMRNKIEAGEADIHKLAFNFGCSTSQAAAIKAHITMGQFRKKRGVINSHQHAQE